MSPIKPPNRNRKVYPKPPNDIYVQAQRFRVRLLKLEADYVSVLEEAYNVGWVRIEEELLKLEALDDLTLAQINRKARLESLYKQITDEMKRLAEIARVRAAANLNDVAFIAQNDAQSLIETVRNSRENQTSTIDANFNKLDRRALENLVAFTADGNPIAEHFQKLAERWDSSAQTAVKQALTEGVILGQNPRKIASRAKALLDADGGNKQQSPEIIRSLRATARTELFRVYRETTRQNFQRNKIMKWEWRSSRTPRTCVICWALDGTIFDNSVKMATHINCRCVLLPVLENSEKSETGPEAFAKLEAGYQQQILGKSRFDLYESGEVADLKEFVAVKEDEVWGASRYIKKLDDVVKSDKIADLNTNIKKVGAGGYWKTIDEKPDSSVIKQKTSLSCVSATGAMLLQSRGFQVTEDEILAEIGQPSNGQALAPVLNRIDAPGADGEKWHGYIIDPDRGFNLVMKSGSWGAVLREGSPLGHLVMVNGFEDELIKINDPWDATSYKMTKEEFLNHWGGELVFRWKL